MVHMEDYPDLMNCLNWGVIPLALRCESAKRGVMWKGWESGGAFGWVIKKANKCIILSNTRYLFIDRMGISSNICGSHTAFFQ